MRMHPQIRRFLAVLIVSLSFAAAPLWADSIELVNGDILNGKLSSVTADHVVLASDLLGEVKLPRAKVAAIHFGDRKPQPKAAPAAAPAVARPAEPTVEDVLRQLKEGGAGGDITKMLEKEFPLLQNPEVKAYFDKTVGGLMSGKLSVNDIRQQALDVRKQVDDLEKDLGPEGMAALKPYLSVLDKFIRDTAPKGGEPQKP